MVCRIFHIHRKECRYITDESQMRGTLVCNKEKIQLNALNMPRRTLFSLLNVTFLASDFAKRRFGKFYVLNAMFIHVVSIPSWHLRSYVLMTFIRFDVSMHKKLHLS